MDDKPMIRQLISNGLAITRVVLDVEDPDEVPPQFSYLVVFSPGPCSANPVLELCAPLACSSSTSEFEVEKRRSP
jgi:hypothetical protein